MNQPKRNLKIWIPIAAVLCFWLGNWMGYTYELTEGRQSLCQPLRTGWRLH